MTIKIARGKRYTYYKYNSYSDKATAVRTGKYFKRRNGSRWKITDDYRNGKKYYNLYLTRMMKW